MSASGRGEDPLVRYEVRGAVAVLTLNRPERHNAWTFELEQELFDLADRADADQRIGAIVLTGAGKSFCPGMDMSALATLGQGPGVAARRRPPMHLRSMRKLTVAAINGGCAGVGFVQALCWTSVSPPRRPGSAARSPGAALPRNTARPGCSPG